LEGRIVPVAIILVEDSKTIRDNLIAALIELADVEMLATADTAQQAITAAIHYADRWRLMVLDLFLKEGSGLTVLRACFDRPTGGRASRSWC
jgi:DNA-binding NarL/FixJ family response regulator